MRLHAGRAAWDNAKDATVDSGRYLAGRAGAIANGDTRDSGGLVYFSALYTAQTCQMPAGHAKVAIQTRGHVRPIRPPTGPVCLHFEPHLVCIVLLGSFHVC